MLKKRLLKIILILNLLIIINTTNVIAINIVQNESMKINELDQVNEIIEENKINLEETENEEVDLKQIQEEVLETSAQVEKLQIDSRIGLIYDRASGNVLYEKNGYKQTPMASTTKILTSIVVLENANLSDVVIVDSKAASTGGSRLGLKKNDKITVNDLLYGLMLCSGNDAAVALAIHVGGSIDGFANLMNEKSKELGLMSSHFVVPHGLDNEEHYTTAYELAKITDYALKIDKIKEIVGNRTATVYINGIPKTINNTNKLLGNVLGVYGVKTGFTNGAGRCLVTACKRDDLDIITVIIGADTSTIRSKDTIKLVEYAYKEFKIVNIKEIVEKQFTNWKQVNSGRIFINKGVNDKVKLNISSIPFKNMAIKNDEINKINVEINAIYYLEAPVKQGEILGNLKVVLNNKIISVLQIYSQEEIKKKDIKEYLTEFLRVF